MKQRTRNIFLPVCLILFIAFFFFTITQIYGNIWAYLPMAFWAAFMPTMGIYCSFYISARSNQKKGKLTSKNLILRALLYLLGFIIIGLIGVFLLETPSYYLETLIESIGKS